ncbi:MAG: glutathione transferase GstA [Myxococcaceae bacterium]|nr:glutathione transferase GstA [Myxococcaceae bacterium]
MRLFYVPDACSLSPHIVLRELGVPFKLDRLDLKAGKKTQAGEDYVTKINPKGYVPALELDDGTILTEGAVIVQYLADSKPEAKLAPKNGTLERVRLQEWLVFIATELHKGFSPLYSPKASDEFKTFWKENKVYPRFDVLARGLEGKKYLMGEDFTVADAYAFYTLRAWQKSLQGELKKWPVLAQYYARIAERPSVRAALEAEAASA